ncbi:MAG: beta-propeller fold lactonase family protein [Desulfuromonadaceae bacterium]
MKTFLSVISLTLFLSGSAYADDIYVANSLSNSVTPVNGTADAVQTDIAAGVAPQEVAASPAGDIIYVSSLSTNEITVIDPRLRTVQDRIPVACSPSSLAILPSGTEALAVCRKTGQVIKIDLVQRKQIAAIPVSFPHSIAVNPEGSMAYVSRSMFSSYVDVINLATFARTASISVGRSPQGLAVSPDGKALYVANNGAGTVSVVDISAGGVTAGILVGYNPRNIAVSPDGATLYVTNYTSGTVSVIDTATSTATNSVTVGVNPHGVAVDSSGRLLYVSNYSSNTLSIIDTKTLQPVATLQTGIGPLGVGLAKVDQVPPLTVPSLAPGTGQDDWHVSPVTVDFAASDSGSGVKEIHYSVDDSAEVVTAGSAAHLVIGSDGAHTVTYYAVDNAGNVEQGKKLDVNIDQTPPALTLSLNRNVLWPPNHKMVDVLVNGIPADQLSGIASAVIRVDDEYGIYSGTVSGFGGAVRLEAWREGNDLDGRRYTITVAVTDKAGNSTTGTSEVIVPHDMGKQAP